MHMIYNTNIYFIKISAATRLFLLAHPHIRFRGYVAIQKCKYTTRLQNLIILVLVDWVDYIDFSCLFGRSYFQARMAIWNIWTQPIRSSQSL